MNKMIYKGYAARIEYSEEDRCLIGHIAGIKDVVGFHGESVGELRTALQACLDANLKLVSTNIDPQLVLERLLIGILTKPANGVKAA